MTNICGGIGLGEVPCGEITLPVWDLWFGDIDSQRNLSIENGEIPQEIADSEVESGNSFEVESAEIIGLTIE